MDLTTAARAAETSARVPVFFWLLVPAVLLFASFVSAQIPRPTPPDITERNRLASDPDDDADGPEYEGPKRDMLPYEMTRAVERKLKFSGPEKDSTSAVRKAADLKMLKIFSAPECAAKKLVIDVSAGECKAAVDLIRASFYSFLSGYYGESMSDFRIVGSEAIAGNGTYLHGLIVDLGTADPASIDKTSDAAAWLIDYPIAKTLDEEKTQRGELEKGITAGGRVISSKAKLTAGNVYLMRLVNYSFKRDRINFYNRDAVYLIRFGGINDDQMGIILWKKLSDRDAPKL